MTFIFGLQEKLPVREREHRMLRAVSRIARGELCASDVEREEDLRQLGYLASLCRGRCDFPGRLTIFVQEARQRLASTETPAPLHPIDPLQARWGARYGLGVEKVRSELRAYLVQSDA